MMIKRTPLIGGIGGIMLAGVASASIVSITFENDTPGFKPNGFQSVDSSLVSFSDSEGSDLQVANFGIQSIGQGLAVGTDNDSSILMMDFGATLDSISLDFGHDDPALTLPGDYARLSLYLDGQSVDDVIVEMNRDNAMNQTISFSGQFFNSATVEFYASKNLGGLTEVVDNITFNTVPAPGLLPMGMLALLGATGGRRRTK